MQRRDFLKNTGIITLASLLVPQFMFGRRSASAIQLGIIGTGSRGTAVITSMMKNNNCRIVAMADLFDDKLKEAQPVLNQLNKEKGHADIKSENMYRGSKAFEKLLANKEVDAVIISSPAYTHPTFVEAAVAAGKHIYCEKPVAIDVEGCKRIQKAGQSLSGKSGVVGFQIRHATAYGDMIKRVQRGDIGDIINVQLYYLSSANAVKSTPSMSRDEKMIRDHFHYRATSGGILLDQGIHMIDVCNWGLMAVPLKATGSGGLKASEHHGDAWNHYQVVYEYPKGIHVSCHSTQFGNQFGDVCARFLGTKGIAEAHYSGGVFIKGENAWDSGIVKSEAEITEAQRASGAFLSSLHDADPNKGKSFINSIETGRHLNEFQQGASSTLTAILGRQAAEKRKEVQWDTMIKENEKLNAGLDLKKFD